jgi:hypothetical protein
MMLEDVRSSGFQGSVDWLPSDTEVSGPNVGKAGIALPSGNYRDRAYSLLGLH